MLCSSWWRLATFASYLPSSKIKKSPLCELEGVKISECNAHFLICPNKKWGWERLLSQQACAAQLDSKGSPQPRCACRSSICCRSSHSQSWDNTVADRQLFNFLTEVVSKHKQKQEQRRGRVWRGTEGSGCAHVKPQQCFWHHYTP